MTAGCGGSSRMPQFSHYHPPLRVSPNSLASGYPADTARNALRTIARTMSSPEFRGERPVRFSRFEYRFLIMNAGSPNAFSTQQAVAEEIRVLPDSSAKIHQRVVTSPRLVSTMDRVHWRAGGRPQYETPASHAGASNEVGIASGDYSFTPLGRTVTFARARR